MQASTPRPSRGQVVSDKKPRHRWLKLRLHVYLCKKCGCGKENVQKGDNYYETMYHLPTGESKFMKSTPACEVGPRTALYLAKYQAQIDEAMKPAREKALADPSVQAILETFPAQLSDLDDDFESESAEDANA